jgi:alpha-L-fucosidase
MRLTPLALGVLCSVLFLNSPIVTRSETIDKDHEKRIAWFREAKFGMFIHWGLYSIPAGEWQGKQIPGLGEWIMHNAPISVSEYSKLANRFNPVKFDAEKIVQLAVDSGMKYIVITSKHHDGFAMYHSSVSKYNIFDATPLKRDPLKELADACMRHNIKLGFYYSQSQDWHEANGAGNTFDFGDDDKKDFDRYLTDKSEPQVRELLTNYGPVCLMWFDTPYMMTEERGSRFMNLVRKLQPACLIDGRLSKEVHGDYISTGDNVVPNKSMTEDWEVPATTNNTWGFRKDDTDWKSPGEIIFKLVDVASKGGNYLLNIGPTSEGLVPEHIQENLLTVGKWLKLNGEAIYGVSKSPFGEEFGEFSSTMKDHSGKAVFLPRTDWRCTVKNNKYYFILFRKFYPRDGFELPPVKGSIRKAYFLSDPEQTPLSISLKDGVRCIQLPRNAPDPMALTICVELAGM